MPAPPPPKRTGPITGATERADRDTLREGGQCNATRSGALARGVSPRSWLNLKRVLKRTRRPICVHASPDYDSPGVPPIEASSPPSRSEWRIRGLRPGEVFRSRAWLDVLVQAEDVR